MMSALGEGGGSPKSGQNKVGCMISVLLIRTKCGQGGGVAEKSENFAFMIQVWTRIILTSAALFIQRKPKACDRDYLYAMGHGSREGARKSIISF